MKRKNKSNGSKGFIDRSPIYDTRLIPAAESHRAFAELHRELYEEYLPVGFSEEHLVQRLAFLFFERDRLSRYTHFKMEMRQAELERQIPKAQAVRQLKSHVDKIEEANVLREVKESLSEAEAGGEPKPAVPGRSGGPKVSFDSITTLPDGPVNGRDVFLKLVEEFPIAERIKQHEQIDQAIDRTIKKLMQLKTMKQMYRQLEPRVISPPERKGSPN